jgi:hypothetical protein
MRDATRRVLVRRTMPADGDCLYHAVATTAPRPRGMRTWPRVVGLRRRPVPADGSCLYHAVAVGVPGATAAGLRALAADSMEAWADAPDFAAGLSLREWAALHDDGARAWSARAWSARVAGVRGGAWGDALALAVLARALRRRIEVHQCAAGGGAPVAVVAGFGPVSRRVVHVLRHGDHYDGLVLDS